MSREAGAGERAGDGHGGAVAVAQDLAADGGDARAGGDDADEVERVDGGDLEVLGVGGDAAERGEGLDGLGQRELLALLAGDEAAAADLPARLESAVDVEEGAPRRR